MYTMFLIFLMLACETKDDVDVSYGGNNGSEPSATEEPTQEPSSVEEPSSDDTGSNSCFDAGTPDDTSDDPEGGPECAACGWFCSCETGSETPSDWHDCSVGYDCLDHCIDASASPAVDWFTCVMNTGGEDCDVVFECGYPEF